MTKWSKNFNCKKTDGSVEIRISLHRKYDGKKKSFPILAYFLTRCKMTIDCSAKVIVFEFNENDVLTWIGFHQFYMKILCSIIVLCSTLLSMKPNIQNQ